MSTLEAKVPVANQLAEWLKKTQGTHGGALNPSAMTFCQCCGSQYLDENGLIYNSKTSGHHGPTAADVEAHYAKKYGINWRGRFAPTSCDAMVLQGTRVNKPGVTIAYMGVKQALDILYPDPEWGKLADGYEIHDPSFSHPVSVVWVNK